VFAERMSQRTTASLAIRHAAAGTRLPLGSALCPRRRCVCSSSVHRSTIHRSLASSIHRGTKSISHRASACKDVRLGPLGAPFVRSARLQPPRFPLSSVRQGAAGLRPSCPAGPWLRLLILVSAAGAAHTKCRYGAHCRAVQHNALRRGLESLSAKADTYLLAVTSVAGLSGGADAEICSLLVWAAGAAHTVVSAGLNVVADVGRGSGVERQSRSYWTGPEALGWQGTSRDDGRALWEDLAATSDAPRRGRCGD